MIRPNWASAYPFIQIGSLDIHGSVIRFVRVRHSIKRGSR